jgi:hypothetical protein
VWRGREGCPAGERGEVLCVLGFLAVRYFSGASRTARGVDSVPWDREGRVWYCVGADAVQQGMGSACATYTTEGN